MNISSMASCLIKKFGTRNPFKIIEQLNIIVVVYPLEGVNGFYQYFQRNNIIYINERLSESEKIFVCAHELGHMFLHKNANALFMDSRTHLNTDKYEIEADKFAVELLISDEDIDEHNEFTISQLARLFGYSEQLIKLRLQ